MLASARPVPPSLPSTSISTEASWFVVAASATTTGPAMAVPPTFWTVTWAACVPNVTRAKSSVSATLRPIVLVSTVTTCDPLDRSSLPLAVRPLTVTPGAMKTVPSA